MTFQDQVVIITGASSGIGWALAKEFSRQGAKARLTGPPGRETQVAQRRNPLGERRRRVCGCRRA